MSPLDKLIRLAIAAMQAIAVGTGFERQMTTFLTRTYTAALLVATAERLNVSVDTLGGLTRADRDDIKQAVVAQLPYLAGFVATLSELSDVQIAARQTLYAASVRPFYFATRWGAWDIPSDLLPGNQTCHGNCRCDLTITDNEDGTGVLTRTLGDTDHSCQECLDLAGDHVIERRLVNA